MRIRSSELWVQGSSNFYPRLRPEQSQTQRGKNKRMACSEIWVLENMRMNVYFGQERGRDLIWIGIEITRATAQLLLSFPECRVLRPLLPKCSLCSAPSESPRPLGWWKSSFQGLSPEALGHPLKGAKQYAFRQILLVILMLTEVCNFSNSFTLKSLNFFKSLSY